MVKRDERTQKRKSQGVRISLLSWSSAPCYVYSMCVSYLGYKKMSVKGAMIAANGDSDEIFNYTWIAPV